MYCNFFSIDLQRWNRYSHGPCSGHSRPTDTPGRTCPCPAATSSRPLGTSVMSWPQSFLNFCIIFSKRSVFFFFLIHHVSASRLYQERNIYQQEQAPLQCRLQEYLGLLANCTHGLCHSTTQSWLACLGPIGRYGSLPAAEWSPLASDPPRTISTVHWACFLQKKKSSYPGLVEKEVCGAKYSNKLRTPTIPWGEKRPVTIEITPAYTNLCVWFVNIDSYCRHLCRLFYFDIWIAWTMEEDKQKKKDRVSGILVEM